MFQTKNQRCEEPIFYQIIYLLSTRGFGARSQFGVKGIRIYADGIPLNSADGQGQAGSINIDTLGQIEFLRGPFSALYGNSSGGVVQAFTRDGAHA